MKRYYGKYRGIVEDNRDPWRLGRVQVSVARVFGKGSHHWAMPCVPYAGAGVGLFVVPPIGANVWVEFEEGDKERPVWTGAFWGKASEVPEPTALPDVKTFKTSFGTITFDDRRGSSALIVETASGAKISLTESAVEISNGRGASIRLAGNTVSINGAALEVT